VNGVLAKMVDELDANVSCAKIKDEIRKGVQDIKTLRNLQVFFWRVKKAMSYS